MGERILVQGNEAICLGAVGAGCHGFFGYPITPQNEITEWFARELPKRGGVFVQSQSETGSINMLFGGAATGRRVMTSTSSPGWSLMQEGFSCLANAELPCVVVLVQRAGPGQGTTRHGQTDYTSATHGGGHGGYKNIVLAAATVPENYEFVQLAFHLADKYRNPVIVLTDAIIGQMAEPLELKALDFGSLPPKDWALGGKKRHADGQRRIISCGQGQVPIEPYTQYLYLMEALDKKFKAIQASEVRYETYKTEDAELAIVAYGSMARVSKEAVNAAREQGLKVGLLRPITLWPFPQQAVKDLASKGVKLLVVEDSLGQMVEDVKLGVEGKGPVHFLGMLARHNPTDGGMILPGRILQEIKSLLL
ncbi:MAG: 3-methyl-2-oxobutanoate dehydrogenase subunit VorB [Dehalococcoidia bacterium]|nr:3-methyl-2-oxobutanoate dehydrogenase subunit VorB [Dehalococcoidia bacterium]